MNSGRLVHCCLIAVVLWLSVGCTSPVADPPDSAKDVESVDSSAGDVVDVVDGDITGQGDSSGKTDSSEKGDATGDSAGSPSDASSDVLTDVVVDTVDGSGDGSGADVPLSDGSSEDGASSDATASDGLSQDGQDGTFDADTGAADAGFIDVASLDTTKPDTPWQDPNQLPAAKFTDVTTSWPLDGKALYAWCAVAGRFDKDKRDDALFVRYTAKGGAFISVVLLGGAAPKVVDSKVDTSLLIPNLGCGAVDFDGDGDDDLWLGGTSGLALYENDGTGSFIDVSMTRLPASLPAQPWSVSPADWDGDGDVDLLVGAGKLPASCKTVTCSYVPGDFICKNSNPIAVSASEQDILLEQGAPGVFKLASQAWTLSNTEPYATTVSDYDLDGDGDPDLLQGNDYGDQFIWTNQAPGWKALPTWSGVNGYANAMGWGVVDLDNDGVDELIQTDFGPAQVWRRVGFASGGEPIYQDRAADFGVAGPTWGSSNWNPLVADFDHDERPDLWLGIAMTGSSAALAKTLTGCNDPSQTMTSVDVLWLNQGSGKPMAAYGAPTAKCADVAVVAQSMLDIDDDGDLDIIQVRPGCAWPGGVVRVLRNDLSKAGPVVRVRLIGPSGNPHGIGAVLKASVGGQMQRQYVYGNRGIGSTSTRTKHFGLGKHKQIDSLEVVWPGGKSTKHNALLPGAVIELKAP